MQQQKTFYHIRNILEIIVSIIEIMQAAVFIHNLLPLFRVVTL